MSQYQEEYCIIKASTRGKILINANFAGLFGFFLARLLQIICTFSHCFCRLVLPPLFSPCFVQHCLSYCIGRHITWKGVVIWMWLGPLDVRPSNYILGSTKPFVPLCLVPPSLHCNKMSELCLKKPNKKNEM